MSEENLKTSAVPPRRVRWEYRQLVTAADTTGEASALDDAPVLADALRDAGAAEWELVTIVPTSRGVYPALLCVFKRPAD